jgi:hypothetical protein
MYSENQAYNEENFKPKQRFYYRTQNWPDITKKIAEQTNCYLSSVTHGRSHIRMALDTSVISNWKINNPTRDVVNDVNQDFSLKYSNNKMGTND